MITHCPSCHTHFRVNSEQLAARAGQVRCGKCNRVFDALAYLVEGNAAATVSSVQRERASSLGDTAAARTEQVSIEAQAPAIAAGHEGEAQTAFAGDALHGAPAKQSAPPPGFEPWTASGADAFDFGPIAATDPAARLRRWPWLLGALLLLLLLLAQAAYHYRSAIIVLFPQAKPYASALCATLRCDLPLPRRIELMSIEASDLQADTTNPNIMVLSATLKNRAPFDQQFPLLELTLTDAQDQPVVRRVLAPPDYLGKAANARTGFAANSETAIKVYIEGSQVKATGYRLYLFYP